MKRQNVEYAVHIQDGPEIMTVSGTRPMLAAREAAKAKGWSSPKWWTGSEGCFMGFTCTDAEGNSIWFRLVQKDRDA
ncbi:hypothetical protein P0Y35_05890 [Kiritimatiellaeota bacterium B1221]|nr:hypothetical protein [Kiritimatiellaeota bacterium B1221]